MELLLHVALSVTAGASGGWLVLAVQRFRQPKVTSRTTVFDEEAVHPGPHPHDWHISGKKNNRVRMRCIVPGCRLERNQDGPE